MADDTGLQCESALECLLNIADVGGYMKKETKEEIQNAVRTIRDCFLLMKLAVEKQKSIQNRTQNDDVRQAGAMHEGEDSRHKGQLATSVGQSQEVEDSGNQSEQAPPSIGDERNNNASHGGACDRQNSTFEEGTGEENNDDNHGVETRGQSLDAASNLNHMRHEDTDIEGRIIQKINQQMQSMMRDIAASISRMIKEEMEEGPNTAHNNNSRRLSLDAPGKVTEGSNTYEGAESGENGYYQDKQEGWSEVRRRRGPNPRGAGTREYRGNNFGEADHGENGYYREEQEGWKEVRGRRGANPRSVGSREYRGNNYGDAEHGENGYYREEQEGWNEVRRRRGTNSRITGTREDKGTALRAADRTAWLYIGRLHQTTEREDLINYMSANGINGTIECEELEVVGRNRAFRVGIPFDMKEQVEQPQLWPKGIVVRQYIFRRQQRQGIRL